MTARALIAHGGPQRLPTRAAPSLVKGTARRARVPSVDSVDDPLPLDRHHPSYATCIRVDGADRCDPHADSVGRVKTRSRSPESVITFAWNSLSHSPAC